MPPIRRGVTAETALTSEQASTTTDLFEGVPEALVEHDQDACPFCQSSDLIRTAVQEGGYTGCGWGCSVCGWWTTDLGTMHEQLWPTGGRLDMRATDMVCPDCGVEGAFIPVERPSKPSNGGG